MNRELVSARQSDDGSWSASFSLLPETLSHELVVTVQGGCACRRDMTVAELQTGLSALGDRPLFSASQHGLAGTSMTAFLDCLNRSMDSYGIRRCIDKAHFLAQVAVESDNLRTTAEYKNRDGSYPRSWGGYRGGPAFHGRGLLQITHDHNYRKYSDHAGIDYVADPELIASSVDTAVDSACWFWRMGSAWGDLSKRAKSNDFIWITIGVNGGFNHHRERKAYLQSLVEALGIGSCETYGEEAFDRFQLEDSALRRTRMGPVYWRNHLGEADAI